MYGVKVSLPMASLIRSLYAKSASFVSTGGTRFGIIIAPAKSLELRGATVLSISSSRRCKCISRGEFRVIDMGESPVLKLLYFTDC